MKRTSSSFVKRQPVHESGERFLTPFPRLKSNINHFDTQADCEAMAAIITKNFDDSYPGEAQTYRIVACRKPNGHRSWTTDEGSAG